MKLFDLSSSRGIFHARGQTPGTESPKTRALTVKSSRLSRMLATGLVSVALLAGFGNARAEEPKPVPPKPVPYGDWALRCPAKDKDKEPCSLSQRILVEVDGKKAPIVFFNFVHTGKPKALHAILRLPLGISLPRGMSLQVDKNSPITGSFSHCDREGCLTVGKITPELRKNLEAGQKAFIVFHTLDGKPVTVPASLKGITAGLKALDKKK
uniref:Invasion protein IalB, involved in pathogenesis n=1 Tax=Candidatus Kentrum sp. LPFa TaxID=2126335 RepID=A0A450XZZ8_9GAMM|nr:MAG: Invasion protein IalB, involved in pathogenesis [Candidatus Kentron sp. LPFa]VFK34856.1 MAG: Invasion protein IalB, involved in pathogenesis [Candidatus Kentron sp. LPFa]